MPIGFQRVEVRDKGASQPLRFRVRQYMQQALHEKALQNEIAHGKALQSPGSLRTSGSRVIYTLQAFDMAKFSEARSLHRNAAKETPRRGVGLFTQLEVDVTRETQELLLMGGLALAGLGTRQLLETAWEKQTRRPAPKDPTAPGVTWQEALLWGAMAGLAVGVTRTLVRRGHSALVSSKSLSKL